MDLPFVSQNTSWPVLCLCLEGDNGMASIGDVNVQPGHISQPDHPGHPDHPDHPGHPGQGRPPRSQIQDEQQNAGVAASTAPNWKQGKRRRSC